MIITVFQFQSPGSLCKMSVPKADGITMFTFTSKSQSPWRPLFQILKSPCYRPLFSAVSKHLSGSQRASETVLGVLQVRIGLLSIGLGAFFSCTGLNVFGFSSFPYWSGAMFIVLGIKALLFEKHPTWVILNMILYLTGFGIAMVAFVVYTMNMIVLYTIGNYGTNSQEKYLEAYHLILMVILVMNLLLIVLSGVEVGVTLTSAFWEIKAHLQRQNMSTDDPELHKPVLIEVTALHVV
ncbi:unnamed protein product [Oreochromis niloticus]|uniref:Uncharacterized protein n=1 Tax=Oreochromis niloticus TaxID=8128 RepID=A0A669ECK0_ORENI|nr:unnamed protein product [Mustela putorius furo]